MANAWDVTYMWKWLNENGQALEAIAGVITAIFSLMILRAAWSHFRHVRTSSYVERYNAAEFVKIRAEVDQFLYLTEKMSPLERGHVYKHLLLSDHLEDINFRHQIWTFAMLFNEIGAAWERRVIDDCLIKNFDRIIPRYWIRLRPYMMNLHLRFRFELPANLGGFEGRFKLFNSFRLAYLRMQAESGYLSGWRRVLRWLSGLGRSEEPEITKIGIDPVDLETSSMLARENHLPLEKAMNWTRPQLPCHMDKSVIRILKKQGVWTQLDDIIAPQTPIEITAKNQRRRGAGSW